MDGYCGIGRCVISHIVFNPITVDVDLRLCLGQVGALITAKNNFCYCTLFSNTKI